MRKKRIFLIVLLLFGIGLLGVHAQESLNTIGGNASGTGGTVSYSIGQVMYQTYTWTSGSIAEGVQQSYEISVVTAIEETESINLLVSAYPNPTANFLTLEIKQIKFSNTQFQLYDALGKLLRTEKITDDKTIIDMSNLVPATYFVIVTQENKEVKTFKIIKN